MTNEEIKLKKHISALMASRVHAGKTTPVMQGSIGGASADPQFYGKSNDNEQRDKMFIKQFRQHHVFPSLRNDQATGFILSAFYHHTIDWPEEKEFS